MPDADLSRITLAILAGGAGTRMGRAKGLLEVRGTPILSFLLDRLAWPGPTLLVTAPGREHPPGWEQFGREVTDPVANEGPLRGVMTALTHATTESLVVAAVDMPGVTQTDLAWLAAELGHGVASLVMASRAGAIEPLPCACRADAKDLIVTRLTEGRRSLHGLATDARVAVVPADDRDGNSWLNTNTPDEWDAFMRSLPT